MIDQTWIDNSQISTGDLIVLIAVLIAPLLGWFLGYASLRRNRKVK